jgi:hypothetical protein
MICFFKRREMIKHDHTIILSLEIWEFEFELICTWSLYLFLIEGNDLFILLNEVHDVATWWKPRDSLLNQIKAENYFIWLTKISISIFFV